MTTPTIMTTSMITVTTTIMANVVVVPSFRESLVGCVMLIEVTPTVWEEVGFNSVQRKHTSRHFTSIAIKDMKEISISFRFMLP